MTFCAEGAEKIFLRALLFLVQEARGPNLGTRGRPAPRAEVALLFLVQEARGPNLGTRGRPAPRAEVALLFLVQEAATHTRDTGLQPGRRAEDRILDFSRRVEQRWPYYFLCRRLLHTRDTGPRPVEQRWRRARRTAQQDKNLTQTKRLVKNGLGLYEFRGLRKVRVNCKRWASKKNV